VSYLFVFSQVALDDVNAHVAKLGLDVDEFVALTREAIAEPSGNRETDFVRGLALSPAELEQAGVDSAWQELCKKLGRTYLAHPENPLWCALEDRIRKHKQDLRYARVIRPIGVRTLLVGVQKSSWDFRLMPDDELGEGGTEDELLDLLGDRLLPTVGIEEYLAPNPEARVLAVLATTVAAILSEDAAQKSDQRRRAKLVRPDVYENVIERIGLGKCFQVVRRFLELDHPEHIPRRIAWPRATDPERSIGILEYRGEREKYLRLNPPYFRKLK
jgi:hypothetical protein